MKKFFIIIAMIICIILFQQYSVEKHSLSDGVYWAQLSSLSWIHFDIEKQEFWFVHTSYSSYRPHGKFECKNGKVYASDDKDMYVFEIIDDKTISLLRDESAEVPPAIGTIFIWSES